MGERRGGGVLSAEGGETTGDGFGLGSGSGESEEMVDELVDRHGWRLARWDGEESGVLGLRRWVGGRGVVPREVVGVDGLEEEGMDEIGGGFNDSARGWDVGW